MHPEAARIRHFLAAGWRLARLTRPHPAQLEPTPATLLAIVALWILASFAISWLAAEPPRAFSRWGIQSEGFYLLVAVASCFFVATFLSRADRTLMLCTLLFSAGLFSGSVMQLVQDHLVPQLQPHYAGAPWAFAFVFLLWAISIWYRALTMLELGPAQRRAVAAALVVLFQVWVQFKLPEQRLWTRDYAALYEQEESTRPALIAEEIFARQGLLLDQALATLEPGVPGRPDLYFVAFAPYGDQDVFLKESVYSTRLFEERFGTRGRTLMLVNSEQKVDQVPLATMTNLERSLSWIGAHIDVSDDILFLFLTSHGSPDGSLSVSLGDLSFRELTAETLASALDASGIRWKVLIVSGCYSGTFLDALKDDHTLVISASRADRTSFGCSDGAEFTYFGRAYFEQALRKTRSFQEAFGLASKMLEEWETKENRQRSEPQMIAGKLIEAQLARWRATLPESD